MSAAAFLRSLCVGGGLILVAACQPVGGDGGNPATPKIGEAVATGEACGGMMGLVCADPADFCKIPMEAQCGAADGMGECTPRPQLCTQQYDPVCGCDGTTHGNACMAAASGVSVAYSGECRD